MSKIATYMGLGMPGAIFSNISTATTVATLTDADIGKVNVWNGNAGPARILLPNPELGAIISILLVEDAVTSATLMGTSGNSGQIHTMRDGASTAGLVQAGTTAEGGMLVTFYGLSDTGWLAVNSGGAVSGAAELVSTSTGA